MPQTEYHSVWHLSEPAATEKVRFFESAEHISHPGLVLSEAFRSEYDLATRLNWRTPTDGMGRLGPHSAGNFHATNQKTQKCQT